MFNKDKILAKANLSPDELKDLTIDWSELEKIFEHHSEQKAFLEDQGLAVAETIRKSSKAVHSVNFRAKDPIHLIAKILRKTVKNPERIINLDSYTDEITDLIGVRVLHLFKEDWREIHNCVNARWDLKEKPIVYYREGDILADYEKEQDQFSYSKHEKGYRSVHYLINFQPTKAKVTLEIQVRTLFEEAWSEIDHLVRYPTTNSHPLLTPYLNLFNRLAGSADEMGSFVKKLQTELDKMSQEIVAVKKKESEMNATIQQLEKQIKDLKTTESGVKIKLETTVKTLKERLADYEGTTISPWAGMKIPGQDFLNHYETMFSNIGLGLSMSASKTALDALNKQQEQLRLISEHSLSSYNKSLIPNSTFELVSNLIQEPRSTSTIPKIGSTKLNTNK